MFVQRFLESLADGEWHRAEDLFPHPEFPYLGLEAVVRVLLSEGHAIEQRGEGSEASYRIEPSQGPVRKMNQGA